MDFVEAVGSGDRVVSLRALRDVLAASIAAAESPRDVAPLARQLSLVLAEIDDLVPPEQKGTPLDQLTERRRRRGAATADLDSADGASGP